MSETTYYQRNRDIMLKRAKNYYEITKNYCGNEQKINIDYYRKMKKILKKQYQKARYHNMSDEEKQKLKDYQKKLSRS